jgi:C-terminal processing protease CtpA/Prc
MKKELENLTESDEKVRELLASLKQVEAPKDFEFRLKARIAKASPNAYQTNYKRRFAYALPAFASVLVSTFVVLNGNFFGGAEQVSSIPDTRAQPVNISQQQDPPKEFIASFDTVNKKEPEKISPASLNSGIEKNRSDESPFVAVKTPEKSKNEPRRQLNRENDSFSKDSALTTPKVFRPRGLNPDTRVEAPKDFNSEKSFSVQELLSPLGVEVAAENGKWKVKNVSQNSAAERSGVKPDDVIETLDGQKLSSAPLSGKKIEVKKLGVKRGTAQIEINLQTNPK